METIDEERAIQTNKDFYASFWSHRWKYRLMYDMQIKKKLFLFIAKHANLQRMNKKVLDIGFGSGDILFTFDTSCELSGVDFSPRAVNAAKRYADGKGYRKSQFAQLDLDSANLPFEDGAFDVVISSHVLEHVRDDQRLLKEFHRVLSDDGMGIIMIPINEHPGEDPNHARVYTTAGFLSQLEALGFRIRAVRENEYFGHLTSWFFLRRYHKRIPFLGFLISGLINVPLALLPFSVHLVFDRVLQKLGYKPRQIICCVSKQSRTAQLDNAQLKAESHLKLVNI